MNVRTVNKISVVILALFFTPLYGSKRPMRADGKITGHIYNHGHPVKDWKVELVGLTLNRNLLTTTGDDGEYKFEQLVEENWKVKTTDACGENLVSEPLGIGAQSHELKHDFDLRTANGEPTICGHVHNHLNPVPNCKVSLTTPEGKKTETFTDKDGFYIFSKLAYGEYTVEATVAGKSLNSSPLKISKGALLRHDFNLTGE